MEKFSATNECLLMRMKGADVCRTLAIVSYLAASEQGILCARNDFESHWLMRKGKFNQIEMKNELGVECMKTNSIFHFDDLQIFPQ